MHGSSPSPAVILLFPIGWIAIISVTVSHFHMIRFLQQLWNLLSKSEENQLANCQPHKANLMHVWGMRFRGPRRPETHMNDIHELTKCCPNSGKTSGIILATMDLEMPIWAVNPCAYCIERQVGFWSRPRMLIRDGSFGAYTRCRHPSSRVPQCSSRKSAPIASD